MSSSLNTQLINVDNYDVNNVVFSEPVCSSIPDSVPKIEFKRINISTRNDDGTVGELCIPTEKLFSFGLSTNTNQETGKINGYTYPLCLWNRDGATPQQKQFTDVFNAIVDKCIDHLLEVKDEIELYELSKSDLTKSKGGLNPLYWKKERYTDKKGKTIMRPVPGTGPTLYPKIIYSKKNDKFLTKFYDVDDNEFDPLELMGKYSHTTAVIKIESIFIGRVVSLQVKLYEAVVEPISSGVKRLLKKPKSAILSLKSNQKPTIDSLLEGGEERESESESDDLLSDSDSSVEQKPKAPPVKKVVKRVVKKKN